MNLSIISESFTTIELTVTQKGQIKCYYSTRVF